MTNTTVFTIIAKQYFSSKHFQKMNDNEFKELLDSESYNTEVFNGFLSSLVEYLHPKNKQDEGIIKIGLNIFMEYVGDYDELDEDKKSTKAAKNPKNKKNSANKLNKKREQDLDQH